MEQIRNQLIQSSIQYRLLRNVLSVGLIAIGSYVVYHLITGVWRSEGFLLAGMYLGLAGLMVVLRRVALPRVRTPGDLDMIAIAVFISMLAVHFSSLLLLNDRLGIPETTLVLIGVALAVDSRHWFTGITTVSIVVLIGIHFLMGNPLRFEHFLHLLVLIPVSSWIIRASIETSFVDRMRRVQDEMWQAAEMAQLRVMLGEINDARESLELESIQLREQLAAALELAPASVSVFGMDGRLVSSLGTPIVEGPQSITSGVDYSRLRENHPELISAFQLASEGETQRLAFTHESQKTHFILSPLRDQMGNVVSVAEIASQEGIPEVGVGAVSSGARRLEGLGRLAAGIAHDFNNYLLAIVQFSEFIGQKLSQPAPLDEKDFLLLKKTATEIRKTAINAAQVCDEVLMYSGQSRSSKVILDLNEIVLSAEPILQAVVPTHIELSIQPSDDSQWAEVDELMIQRVLVNIVKNAADSISSSGGRIEIHTATRTLPSLADPLPSEATESAAGKEYSAIVISDNGSGMDRETLSNIFTPYYSKKSGGHGLGLAIAEGIIRSHHGQIICRSKIDQGTEFEVLLPKTGQARGVEGERRQARAAESSQANKKSRKILVVDDEDAVRTSIQWILGSNGYEVRVAATAKQAMEVVQLEPDFDCLVFDFLMPGMNGLELLEEFRDAGITVPCILCTGCSADLEEFSSLPQPDVLLVKPYQFDQLQDAIEGVLSSPGSEKERVGERGEV